MELAMELATVHAIRRKFGRMPFSRATYIVRKKSSATALTAVSLAAARRQRSVLLAKEERR